MSPHAEAPPKNPSPTPLGWVCFSFCLFVFIQSSYYPAIPHLLPVLGLGLTLLAGTTLKSQSHAPPPVALTWLVLWLLCGSVGILHWNPDLGLTERLGHYFIQGSLFLLALHYAPVYGRATVIGLLAICAVVAIQALCQASFGMEWFKESLSQGTPLSQLIRDPFYAHQIEGFLKRQTRIQGLYTNANMLAGFLLFGFPLLLVFLPQSQSKVFKSGTFLGILLSALLGITLLLTRSRSGFLLIFALPFLSLLYSRQKAPFFFTLLLCLSIWSAPIWLPHLPLDLPRSFMSRLHYIQHAFEGIFHHPFWGSGTGSFASEYLRWRHPGDEVTRYAHGYLLQLGVENGVPAGLGLIFLMSYLIGATATLPKSVVPPPRKPIPYDAFKSLGIICLLFSILWQPFAPFLPFGNHFLWQAGFTVLVCLAVWIFHQMTPEWNFRWHQALWLALGLLLCHSFIDFTLDKLPLLTCFYVALGILASELPRKGSQSLPITRFLLIVYLGFASLFFSGEIIAHFLRSHAEQQLQKQAYAKAENSFLRASQFAPWEITNHLNYFRLRLGRLAKGSPEKLPSLFHEVHQWMDPYPKCTYAWNRVWEWHLEIPGHFAVQTLEPKCIQNLETYQPYHQKHLWQMAKRYQELGNTRAANIFYQRILKMPEGLAFDYTTRLTKNTLRDLADSLENKNAP